LPVEEICCPLIAVGDQVINKITAYDKIPLISVLQCNIYLIFKILLKCSSPLWKAWYQQKRKQCVIVCTTHSGISSANLL